ncbi:hypothetical protein SLH46_03700 [Draconibacterium sp. IB214405]|uniref:hypothetical protein n=1 Tax=Draconibacterium sp. IB214405 TaxID=3097352 RepID=UPI002A10FBDF|nr:hypothetical protein [Draconibacterium sp. IB214405]MDX8338275.1 hypothetical protein [Draconibacterium sp. IB214405]
MKSITLEFSKLQILKSRERWRLYFIIVTEHPEDHDKMIVSTFPDPYIRLKPNKENIINFEPEGDPGADGLFVIERELPSDKKVKARIYLRQSRKTTRSLGDTLKDLQKTLGGDAFEIVTDLLGSGLPWLVASKKAFPMIGNVLSTIKDRDMGFVSMDEKFGSEFNPGDKIERHIEFSTGEAKIWWKWCIDK